MNSLSIQQIKIVNQFTSWRFIFFLIWKLPLGFISGIRVKSLDDKQCEVTVPFNFLNKNPFKSMYFAVQAMAAELSTGALVFVHRSNKNTSIIVTNFESIYHKKAVTKIRFLCADGGRILTSLKKAEETNQPQKCIMRSRGYDTSGVCVSEFKVTWSIKKR